MLSFPISQLQVSISLVAFLASEKSSLYVRRQVSCQCCEIHANLSSVQESVVHLLNAKLSFLVALLPLLPFLLSFWWLNQILMFLWWSDILLVQSQHIYRRPGRGQCWTGIWGWLDLYNAKGSFLRYKTGENAKGLGEQCLEQITDWTCNFSPLYIIIIKRK